MYALFTAALTMTAIADRRLIAARWAAFGFAVAMVSIVVDGYRVPGSDTWSSWFTVVTHFVPLLIMIQAFLSRHRKHAPKIALAITIVASIVVMPTVPWEPSHAVRGWFVQAACTSIIALGIPALWRHHRESAIDFVIFAVVTAAALSYAGRTTIMLLNPIAEGAEGIMEFYAGLNVIFHLASALMAMAVGIVLMMSVGHDALQLRIAESNTDALTRVGNRRLYEKMLADDVSGARPICGVIAIDLDHFKKVNDRFGHAEGDRLLTAVGEKLRQLFSKFGRACRIGGEEFVILIDAEHAQALSSLALAAREAISSIRLDGVLVGYRPSASVGFHAKDKGGDLECAVRRADQAVYNAKAGGRDQVVGAFDEKGFLTLRAVA